ncbi:MAG: DM13 domain-containing protein [Chloroflexota bacterium]
MKQIGRSFSAHPAWLAGAFLTVAALSIIGWYLGSPLFVRTYRSDPLPSAAPSLSASTGSPSATSPVSPRPVRSGELGYVDALHNGNGVVRLVDLGGSSVIRFDDVAITNAPDVHVYLSRETGGKWSEATSLYLGGLKATNGSFNYEVPAGTDPASYRSVVVWCRAFRVLITWADLAGP